MIRAVAVVSLIVALTLGSTWYLHRRGYLPGGARVQQTPEVVLRLENVQVAGRSKGTRTWHIKAAKAEVSRTRIYTRLYDIKEGVIYDREKPAAKLSAGQVIYNNIDRSLDVSGGIKVIARNDTVITTKAARYDSWTNTLTCPQKVALKTRKSSAEADSLKANLKTSEVDAVKLRMKVDLGELEKVLEEQGISN